MSSAATSSPVLAKSFWACARAWAPAGALLGPAGTGAATHTGGTTGPPIVGAIEPVEPLDDPLTSPLPPPTAPVDPPPAPIVGGQASAGLAVGLLNHHSPVPDHVRSSDGDVPSDDPTVHSGLTAPGVFELVTVPDPLVTVPGPVIAMPERPKTAASDRARSDPEPGSVSW